MKYEFSINKMKDIEKINKKRYNGKTHKGLPHNVRQPFCLLMA